RLRKYYTGREIDVTSAPGRAVRFLQHPLLQSCLASLIPYFEMQDNFPTDIASLKITEAISILRIIDTDVDSVLANFDDPYKVNLISFMEKDRKSTRLNSSHVKISYAVFCLKKKKFDSQGITS